jgi:hypothetical protein
MPLDLHQIEPILIIPAVDLLAPPDKAKSKFLKRKKNVKKAL